MYVSFPSFLSLMSTGNVLYRNVTHPGEFGSEKVGLGSNFYVISVLRFGFMYLPTEKCMCICVQGVPTDALKSYVLKTIYTIGTLVRGQLSFCVDIYDFIGIITLILLFGFRIDNV